MARVIVTHADDPIGRRIVKALFHDPDVDVILALGNERPPRAFDGFLAGSRPRVTYARLDLAKHRPVSDLGRTLTDHDLGGNEGFAIYACPRARHTQSPSCAQAGGQFAA